MTINNSLDLRSVFFEALDYPEFARTNFFLNKQKNSEWSRGVYFTALREIYHSCCQKLQIFYNARRIKDKSLDRENFQLSVRELVGLESDAMIGKLLLDELFHSIVWVSEFDKTPQSFSPIQILTFVEYALLFIRKEFTEQIGSNKAILPRPRTKSYFVYLISQEAPFFDFPKFKNAVRELIYTSVNIEEIKKLLRSFSKVSIEIVKLWNEDLYFVEKKESNNEERLGPEQVRVEFHSDTLTHSWWSDKEMFDNCKPHSLFLNQDFASYAAKITNLINGEILGGRRVGLKEIPKDFLKDFIFGIHNLHRQNTIETAIANIVQGKHDEAPFRNYFANWFTAKRYHVNRESLIGTKYSDLKIEHDSMDIKIIEFKGWWNTNKQTIVNQLFNYLTQFEISGHVFMINHTQKDIATEYKSIISNTSSGYVSKSWKLRSVKRNGFRYFESHHVIGTQRKLIYHFIFDVYEQKKVH